MVFAYDSEMALQSAVELVNSAEEPDTLTTVAELDAFLGRWSYTGRRERTRAELDAVRARPAAAAGAAHRRARRGGASCSTACSRR